MFSCQFANTKEAQRWDVKNADGVTIYYVKTADSEVGVAYKTKLQQGGGDEPDYGAYSGNIVIPKSIIIGDKTYKVTSIEERAFKNCPSLKSITIPNTIKYIGAYATEGCKNITSVHISDIVAWCKIEFKSNPLEAAHYLYLNGKEVTDLVIPENIDQILNSAFSNCYSLKTVELHDKITSIGTFAFGHCRNLTSCNIPNSVKSIGGGAFLDCINLVSMKLPNSVSEIGKMCFYECYNLVDVVLPENLLSIPESMFCGCTKLSDITIPNSVETIKVGGFFGCENLTSIIVPDNVKTIEQSVFAYCTGLSTVYIGNSVNSIEAQAFRDCINLKKVYCYSRELPTVFLKYTDSNPFLGCSLDQATLYVPDYLVSVYKITEPWSGFNSIIGVSASGIVPVGHKSKNVEYYNIYGRKNDNMYKGINIIREKNGKIRKIIVSN